MGMSAISYILVSLLGKTSSFNMDKLLNRRVLEGESKIVNKDTQIGWKIFLWGQNLQKQIKLFIFLIMHGLVYGQLFL